MCFYLYYNRGGTFCKVPPSVILAFSLFKSELKFYLG